MRPELNVKKAVIELAENDDAIKKTISIIGPPQILLNPFKSPFHSLSRAIVYQQLSGKAASTIYGRVMSLFGGRSKFSAKKVLDISDEDFRAAGLSRAKTRALKDLAYKTSTRRLPGARSCLLLTNAELVDRFTDVIGIGPWTVQMFLMFTLARPDVWPVGDLGIQKGVQKCLDLDELPAPKDLEEIGLRWQPHRTVASWYFWRLADLK